MICQSRSGAHGPMEIYKPHRMFWPDGSHQTSDRASCHCWFSPQGPQARPGLCLLARGCQSDQCAGMCAEGDSTIDITQEYNDPCLRVLAPIMGAKGRPTHLSSCQDPPASSATALHVVAASSLINPDASARDAAVRALVSLKADVNAVEEGVLNDNGKTPLRIAISYLDVATTRALLECKADPNIKQKTVSLGIWGRRKGCVGFYCKRLRRACTNFPLHLPYALTTADGR